MQRITGHLPTDATIWHPIKSKDITRTIRVFLWKPLLKAHRCGDCWYQIQDFDHRSKCHKCGVEDSMTHILTECPRPQRGLEEAKHSLWPAISDLGTIIGCGMAKFTSKTGQCKFGGERLYRILITEFAHLIWKIRCEQVFGTNGWVSWIKGLHLTKPWLTGNMQQKQSMLRWCL